MPMTVLHSTSEWKARFGSAKAGTVLSVGNFDGVHRGHLKILSEIVKRAGAASATAAVVTFDPHPLHVLRPAEAPPLIATLEQRLAGIAAAGMDAVLVLKFDKHLSLLSPKEFVHDILVKQLKMCAILVGDGFRFGHRQAGNVSLLEELGREYHFDVRIVAPVVVRGEIVSSTAIRQAIRRGDVEHARRLLARPFALTGSIQPGDGRGSKALFPTLNLAAEQKLLPGRGVYATESVVNGRCYRSATNVGVRPTFDGGTLAVESHLFDFSGKIASGAMEVRFWKRLRDEKKFGGIEELRAQIAQDIVRARGFFALFDRTHHTRTRAPRP